MPKLPEKYIVFSILIILSGVFTVVVFSTQNSFGGGDHFLHYSLAHWGWKHPEMLFSHWGKPVFTILISPFAQFGMNGARMYNVFIGLLTAYFTWRIARHLKMNQAWAVLFFVVFTPIYFVLLFTSLTEVTFSFFLVLAIFLFFKEKYIWSALVLSFMPLIRNEGIVLLPMFITAYSLKRKFIALPFLTVGFFIVSFLGWPFNNNLWWLITEMPYSGSAKDIYGTGNLFHFLNKNPVILGDFIGILFVSGTLITIWLWTVKDKFRLTDHFYFLLLVVGSFVVFFAAHSYVWWKGIGNSLGLIRVIGSVTPLAALTALVTTSFLVNFKNKYLSTAGIILLIGLISWFTFNGVQKHKYGFSVTPTLKLYDDASSFILENKLDKNKIYYFSTYLIYKLQLDPRDRNKCQKSLPRGENPLSKVPDSSIIVWDAHFGPNEGRMPLEKLMSLENIKVLKILKPKKNFKVLGGHDYQIVVFQKQLLLKPKLRSLIEDFEHGRNNSDENVFKGNKSFKLEKHKKYKPLLDVNYYEVSDTPEPLKINISLAYNYSTETALRQLLMVCTLKSSDGPVFYKPVDMWTKEVEGESWIEKTFHYHLPPPRSINDRLKVYIWNRGGCQVFLDEVSINITPVLPNPGNMGSSP